VTDAHHAGTTPSRATASLTLGWGLVSIPVSLYAVTEGAKAAVERHEYTLDGHPVGRQPYDKETGEPVAADQIVKMATSGTGALVELTDEELAALTAGPRGTADIETFVPLSALADGTYVTEGYNQVRPARTKTGSRRSENPAAAKAFALLLEAMAANRVAALVKVTLRGPARYAAVLPDGRLALLAWARQVRPARALPEAELGEAEVQMGRRLVEAVGISTPVLEDTAGEALARYVDEKAAGSATPPAPAEEAAPVIDLTAALQASLAAASPSGAMAESA
jgi:DNA end-binding protein Ku